MSKPEATFIRSVHKHLPPKSIVDRIGMGGTYTNGVADMYYDGPKSDLWVEYKFVERLPKEIDLLKLTTKPTLTALQDLFLSSRYTNKHEAWVIIGCREGGIILTAPYEWRAKPIKTRNYKVWSRIDLARQIVECTHPQGKMFYQ